MFDGFQLKSANLCNRTNQKLIAKNKNDLVIHDRLYASHTFGKYNTTNGTAIKKAFPKWKSLNRFWGRGRGWGPNMVGVGVGIGVG